MEAPVLFNLVKDLGADVLPTCFDQLLKYLSQWAEDPFTGVGVPDIPPSSNDQQRLA